MSTVSISLTLQQIEDLKNRYSEARFCKTPPYALYQFKLSDCTITAYESKKVVFQGEGATVHAASYQNLQPIKQKNVSSKHIYPQCGSDEVGTGDYFGPIVVCAAYVSENQVHHLQTLGIQDSKGLSDDTIRTLGPQLVSQVVHSLLILNNKKYNDIHSSNHMVAIKAKLHNMAYVHLQKKLGTLPKLCVIDQFVQKSSYYRYLNQEQTVIQDIHFETTAENKYLAVAVASIIARYAFLKAFDAMCIHYDFQFLKGAGNKVDENIKEFVKKYGKEELQNIAKLHFANTKKAGISYPTIKK